MMKLTYFNVRGLAETSRILLAIGKEDYEDFRYPLNITNMERPEFDNDKNEGKLVKSLNMVPFLEVDGAIISQSKSIERFLARRFNLMGGSDIESARIDAICECVIDFKDMYKKIKNMEGKELNTGMTKWFGETLVERLELLENSIDSSDFSVGYNLSLADIVLFRFITEFFDDTDSALKALETTPKIKGIVEHVGKLERVKKWLTDRPQTDY